MVFCSKDPLTAVREAGDCEEVKLREDATMRVLSRI